MARPRRKACASAAAGVNGASWWCTYFYARGNTLDGRELDLESHANSAAARLDPPKAPLPSTDEYWKPASAYAYTLAPAAEVKAVVLAHAGVCGEPGACAEQR